MGKWKQEKSPTEECFSHFFFVLLNALDEYRKCIHTRCNDAAMTLRVVVEALEQPCQNSDIKVKIPTFEF